MRKNHNNFHKLAFNIAKINLGKTNLNPSVGCVIVKNDAVISSGLTSVTGRPHAEFNALNTNKNVKYSDIYTTLEPCTHFGLTPPCTNIIIKKKIRNVYFAFNDVDIRTAKKAIKKLSLKKINVYKRTAKEFNDFYQSYFINKTKGLPLVDAKIAVSKDFYTINKKSRWITNLFSRKRKHLLRSQYNAIISTSKSINKDNSRLNCRLQGLDNNKPDLVIIDRKMKLKKNLILFKNLNKRKIYIVTSTRNSNKFSHFKKKGAKIIYIKKLINKDDFVKLLKTLKGYNIGRILIESGLIFLSEFLQNKLISNLFIFQAPYSLNSKGKNNTSNKMIKKLKLSDKIKVNLNGDKLYKIKLKNV